MQLTKAGSEDSNYFVLVNQMINKEGPGSLYKGIKASWISEGVNDGCMLGLYTPIKLLLGVGAASQSMGLKFLAGGFAGAIGAHQQMRRSQRARSGRRLV